MKPNGSANSRDGLRIKVLGLIALLAALIFIALIFERTRSHPPFVPLETTNANVSDIAPRPERNILSRHSPLRLSQPEAEPETARLISIMLDKSASLPLRQQAARALGKIGTDEAMTVLKTALTNDIPPHVKAAIAEGLGQSPNPEAAALLDNLVNSPDQALARGAARGLAARGDADAVNILGGVLFNDQSPLSVRTEAALALGDVNLPSAQDLLTRAISQIHDEDVVESVLDGLGRRPFSDTEQFFRNYLSSPDVPPESKVLAIESVRDAEGDVKPFLSGYLNDTNPDVRNAAKEALDFLNSNLTNPPGTLQK